MLSKKGAQKKLEKEELKKQRFSIRKFTLGAASVLIGVAFMGMSSQTVSADVVVTNQPGVSSTGTKGKQDASDLDLSGKDQEMWKDKGTSTKYTGVKDTVNKLKPKLDASIDDKVPAQNKNDQKANATQPSTEKSAEKTDQAKTNSQKYTDDQLASLSPNDSKIQAWKKIVDDYKPDDQNKANWNKAHDEFNKAWQAWEKSKIEQKEYVKPLEDSMDALVKEMDQEAQKQIQTKWANANKPNSDAKTGLAPADLHEWKNLVDNYNKSVDSDAEWENEYDALNTAWQKWVDDNAKNVASRKQSFEELKGKIDSLTKLMSKNKDISQDLVKDVQDSWAKDKAKLDNTSTTDHDDYLASLSAKDLADYKKALDNYAKLNQDSNWRAKYDDLVTTWNKWDQSTKEWSTDRENKRKDFQEKVAPKLDDLLKSMNQIDKFNDDYEQNYQASWNTVKDELSKHDTQQITVSVLGKIDLWKNSIDKYNQYLKQNSKNDAAWDKKYITLDKAWQDWSNEVHVWKAKRDSNKQNFVELEGKLDNLIKSMRSSQSSKRFDVEWNKLSQKLSKATDEQIANLNSTGMQGWKDQLDKYNQLVDSNDAKWHATYSEFTKAWSNWTTKSKTDLNKGEDIKLKLDELVKKITSQDYYQKSWRELKTKLESANDIQLSSFTPAQLQSWKDLIEDYNKSNEHDTSWKNVYDKFETAWSDWATAKKSNKNVADAFRAAFDKYADLINLLPYTAGKQSLGIKTVSDLRDYFDNNALLRAANLFHLFGEKVKLTVDTNGNIATDFLDDSVDFGTRGESFNHTGGDIYYIKNANQLKENAFRGGNYFIFSSDLKVKIKDNDVYVNGTKLTNVKPSQILHDDDFINVSDELHKLTQKSKDLTNQKTSDNVTVDFTDNNNEVIDVSNASSKNGFVYANVNGSDLNKAGTFKIKGLYKKEDSPVLIINVTGNDDIQFRPNMIIEGKDGNFFGSGESHPYANKVLWNFVDAKNISINSNLMGSVLAPHAIFTAQTNVDGNIIADTINVTGGETHRWDLHAFYRKTPTGDNPTDSDSTENVSVPGLPKFGFTEIEIPSPARRLALPSNESKSSLSTEAPSLLFGKNKAQLPDFVPFNLVAVVPQPKVPAKPNIVKPPVLKSPITPKHTDTPRPDKPGNPATPPAEPEVPIQPITPLTPAEPETPHSDFDKKFEESQAKAFPPQNKVKYIVHKTKQYKHDSSDGFHPVNTPKYVKQIRNKKHEANSAKAKKVTNILPHTGEQTGNKTAFIGVAVAAAGLILGLCVDKKRRRG